MQNLLVFLFLFWCLVSTPSFGKTREDPDLFLLITGDEMELPLSAPELISRQQSVLFNKNLLKSPPSKISMDIFGQQKTVYQTSMILRGPRDYSWIGEVEKNPLTLVVITVHGESYVVTVDDIGHTYNLKNTGISKSHSSVLREIKDSVREQKHAEMMKRLPPLPEEKRQILSVAYDDLSQQTIDIMIVYTGAVAAASSDIQTEIRHEVDYMNAVLARSCAAFRYRLVHSVQVDYSNDLETASSSTILGELAQEEIGEVASLRDEYGADLVQIWVENPRDVCGVGFAPVETSSWTAIYGYSLKLHLCSPSTTAHELGHNLGLAHDRFQEGLSLIDYEAPYGDGYGFVDLNLGVATIMSYSSECYESGISCTRIPYFSNPRIYYQGVSLGTVGLVNEVHKMNEGYISVANYRASVTAATPDTLNLSCQAIKNYPETDKKSPCFIATAAYGDTNDPHVETLRHFRAFLMAFGLGRKFVSYYYQQSPSIALWLKDKPFFRLMTKLLLSPLILFINIPLFFLFFFSLSLTSLFMFLRKKNIFFLLLLFISYHRADAQMASPSYDFITYNENPALVGYRPTGLSLGANVMQEESEYLDFGYTREKRSRFPYKILVGAGLSFIHLHAFYSPTIKEKRQFNSRLGLISEFVKKQEYGGQLSLNIFGLYLGGEVRKSKELFPTGQNSIVREDILGFSLPFFRMIYLGGTLSKVTQQSYLSSSLTYFKKSLALGFNFATGFFAFRLEGGGSYAPLRVKSAQNGFAAAVHSKEQALFVRSEMRLPLSGAFILLGYSLETIQETPPGSGVTKRKRTKMVPSIVVESRSLQSLFGVKYVIDKQKYEHHVTRIGGPVFEIGVRF